MRTVSAWGVTAGTPYLTTFLPNRDSIDPLAIGLVPFLSSMAMVWPVSFDHTSPPRFIDVCQSRPAIRWVLM